MDNAKVRLTFSSISGIDSDVVIGYFYQWLIIDKRYMPDRLRGMAAASKKYYLHHLIS
jgi:hypothetical protein